MGADIKVLKSKFERLARCIRREMLRNVEVKDEIKGHRKYEKYR